MIGETDGVIVGVVSGRYISADGWGAAPYGWLERGPFAATSRDRRVPFEPASDANAGGSKRSAAAPVKFQAFDTGTAVTALATTELGGRAVVVSGGEDGALHVLDLATGEALSGSGTLFGHEGAVWAVALGELDGRPIAVSGGEDATVRVWDLTLVKLLAHPSWAMRPQ